MIRRQFSSMKPAC